MKIVQSVSRNPTFKQVNSIGRKRENITRNTRKTHSFAPISTGRARCRLGIFATFKNSQKSTPKSPNKFKSIHQSIHRTKVFGHPKKKKEKEVHVHVTGGRWISARAQLPHHHPQGEQIQLPCFDRTRQQFRRHVPENQIEKRSVVLLFTQSNIKKKYRFVYIQQSK